MDSEAAKNLASHWMRIEAQNVDQPRRFFEVTVGLSALPDLEEWALVPIGEGQEERALLGLAGGRLYKFAAHAGEVAVFTTVSAPVDDVHLAITDSVSTSSSMIPGVGYRDGRVERVWHFSCASWEARVRASSRVARG